MKTLGNVLWIIFGGIWLSFMWVIWGIILCVTIIGIPFGKQCFKMAKLSFLPFGKEVKYGGGAPSLIFNILWIIFAGIAFAFVHFIWGVIFCVTIIGIPFGLQCFKMAKLALMPFGTEIE